MNKFKSLVYALCLVFCPLGIVVFIEAMCLHFNFGAVTTILSYVALCYFCVYEIDKNIQLRSKIKDLTNELDNLKFINKEGEDTK